MRKCIEMVERFVTDHGWIAEEVTEHEFHVHPVCDVVAHLLSVDCRCNPRIERVDGGVLVVHNSYDRREYDEYLEAVKGRREM